MELLMACKIPTDISKSKSVRKILESWEKITCISTETYRRNP